MTGRYQPRGRFDARQGTTQALRPGILTEALFGRPGILSYVDPDDDVVDPEAPPPDQAFASDPDADADGDSNLDTDPDASEALPPGALTGAPTGRPGIFFYPGPSADSARQDATIPPPIPVSGAEDAPAEKSSIGHADGLEALIPIWGAGRNTIADLQEGNYGSAAFNAALLASDFFLLGAPLKFIARAALTGARRSGLKGALESSKYAMLGPLSAKEAKHTQWKHVRGKYTRHGVLKKYQHGHHWAFHQNEGLGRHIPEAIKNHPWNIIGMPADLSIHGRLHGRYKGAPEFNRVQKYWHGTPRWFKQLNAEMIARPSVMLFTRRENTRDENTRDESTRDENK